MSKPQGGGSAIGPPPLNPQPMEITMILQVTDEDETLILEFLELEDLKIERILPLPR
jgi:hypothetical protein